MAMQKKKTDTPTYQRFLKYAALIGPLGLAIATIVQYAVHGSDNFSEVLLVNGITWLIGGAGIGAGLAHVFYGPPVAASIGWEPSPFQYEVGVANMGIGLAGVLASYHSHEYWLAVIIVATVFLWGAAIGHIREMVVAKNFAPNNAGFIFWTDILSPLFLIYLYNVVA
jgi:hypothetical protein